MDDLFSDLSSISDCDEECLLNISTKNSKCFFIISTQPEIVLEIPPAYELEEVDVRKQKTLEEKNCETDSRGDQTYDKWVQTEFIEMESFSCLADLPPTYREATYTESALERVLRHMSAHLHRIQLQQWLADQPQRNASFHIKPVQTKTIFEAVYNRERLLT
ncbi:hypothetical protein GCK72_003826 [Caenorhabditis remanei]|uniref:Uncharacterized protein n=1 Tax=Caenorhabditis remanei TaxID=31234 RepID=A0A6A5H7R9_CAERE|nr:hypothetical protein GCK72_003826 [Caenorhabditis remanei]KAF1763880.1 hypothetical protein GCK72_003826 [Caenorhabditis remanei]